MPRKVEQVPFDGTPPDVKPGDTVWCRDAFNRWRERTALSGPRYDMANAMNWKCYLTVQIDGVSLDGGPANWPAEDVRTTPPEGGATDAPLE